MRTTTHRTLPLLALALFACKSATPAPDANTTADAARADAARADARVPDAAPDSAPPDANALKSPLGHLDAGTGAPIYTIYAAPLARSRYLLDEGYQLTYDRVGLPVAFQTDYSGQLAFAFHRGDEVAFYHDEFAARPRVTKNYADAVELVYQPLRDLRVRHAFVVHTSGLALHELTFQNAGSSSLAFTVYPIYSRGGNVTSAAARPAKDGVSFRHSQAMNTWTEATLADYQVERQDLVLLDRPADSLGGYATELAPFFGQAKTGALNGTIATTTYAFALARKLVLAPGATTSLRLVRGVAEGKAPAEELAKAATEVLKNVRPARSFAEADALYARVPAPVGLGPDETLAYYQAFTLVRQMMLPPEGRAKTNYYVFSREPTWSWGHDGQVFHESLVMLAYAHLDAESAMGSQRVFMQNQQPDGYVNYRIGPYVAQEFPVKGEKTSSAPFFAWTNWEVYRITKDKTFLAEAYASSQRYLAFFMKTRDKDGDGLYEWGGHAVLECVRDGANVVWQMLGGTAEAPRQVEALDLNVMLVRELKSLADMADALGKSSEGTAYRAQAEALAARVNATMWDDERGFYYHVDKATNRFVTDKGLDLRRQEIIGFLPLWAEMVPTDRLPRLLAHLRDTTKFWRRYGVPTLAADDPGFTPAAASCCRWNGPVWLQWSYLVLRGLLNYGYTAEAKELATRSMAAVLAQLRRTHRFHESYSPDHDTVTTIAPYVWDGILARMFIDVAGGP